MVDGVAGSLGARGDTDLVVDVRQYLEAESSLQIYGNLTQDLIRAISAAAQTDGGDSNVTIRQPFAGFDRLPAS